MLNNELNNLIYQIGEKIIERCAEMYKFDADEAKQKLLYERNKKDVDEIESVKSVKSVESVESVEKKLVEKKSVEKKSVEKKVKNDKVKGNSKIPLPYNGECNEEKCQALRDNWGLYTQCTVSKKEGDIYCGWCNRFNTGPEYGTIKTRSSVDIFEFKDPKGKSPKAYTKVMLKFKLTKEQVLEEAERLGVKIDERHFEEESVSSSSVSSSSSSSSVKKVVEEKKGRPKKEKKEVEIIGKSDMLEELAKKNKKSNPSREAKIEEKKIEEKESVAEAEAEVEEKEDRVKEFKYNDIKYFRSSVTNIIYDYDTINTNPTELGKYDPATRVIVFFTEEEMRENEESDRESVADSELQEDEIEE